MARMHYSGLRRHGLSACGRRPVWPPPQKWQIDVEPLDGWEPRFLPPAQAKSEFLAMFAELQGGRSNG